jgi:ornithine cyclodeaminase/alanine dehydrogenase-like protein (mu-crystallin family)
VVLTLTSSPEPVLFGRWLKKDAMVCAVGAVTPNRRELDDEAMRGAVVV